MLVLPNPSEEQMNIIKYVKNKKSVTVNAVAGSGKTTLVLSFCKLCSDKKVLQLTYNSLLASEVRAKVNKNKIENIEIHTYHSMALKYYLYSGYTDTEMEKVIKEDMKLKIELPEYDIIVVDETQDMTILYYSLVNKIIRDLNRDINILILGDYNQGLYAFKGADPRYLTLSNKIWNEFSPMIDMPLKTSYRVTNNIAWFINNAMLGEERLKTEKKGYLVDYVYENSFEAYETIMPEIMEMLKKKEITPNDIFVLAYSLKSSMCPVKKLEHAFVVNGIECYVPISDESKIDDDIIKNKVVFSTFHQAKGRERPVVILYGFDESHFMYYERDIDKYKCPSTLYVGASRASLRLFLVHDINRRNIDFLKMSLSDIITSGHVKYHGPKRGSGEIIKKYKPIIKIINVKPTELVKFLNQEIIGYLDKIINKIYIKKNDTGNTIEITSKIMSKSGNFEQVSNLNGIVIPAMYEAKQKGISTLQKLVYDQSTLYQNIGFYKKYMQNLKKENLTVEDYLHLGNIFHSMCDGYYNNLYQITNYDWLTTEQVNECHKNMEKHVSKNLVYEYDLQEELNENDNNDIINSIIKNKLGKNLGYFIFSGVIDACDDEKIWEFKCVQELTMEHFLQLIIYAWIWNSIHQQKLGNRQFLLMNICTEEIYQLDLSSDINKVLLDDVMITLMLNKYDDKKYFNDQEFINNCINVKQKIKKLNKLTINNLKEEPVMDKLSDLDNNNFNKMTLKELKQYCKNNNIIKYSNKNKNELIEYIKSS